MSPDPFDLTANYVMEVSKEKLIALLNKLQLYYLSGVSTQPRFAANFDAIDRWLQELSKPYPDRSRVAELLRELSAANLHPGTAWEEVQIFTNAWARTITGQDQRGQDSLFTESSKKT